MVTFQTFHIVKQMLVNGGGAGLGLGLRLGLRSIFVFALVVVFVLLSGPQKRCRHMLSAEIVHTVVITLFLTILKRIKDLFPIVLLHVNNRVATEEPVRKKVLWQTQASVSCLLVCF